jgi:hypothetical protein
MNSLSYILQLIGWVLLQGILLNNMNLFGYANPALYLLFFMTYPAVADRALLLLLAALSGLAIDALSNTSGLYSCATLCVVFLRPLLIRLFFGQSFEDQQVNLLQVSSTLRVLYVLSFSLIFHLIFSLLDTFQWQLWLYCLKKTLINVAFTTIVCLLVALLVSSRKEVKY